MTLKTDASLIGGGMALYVVSKDEEGTDKLHPVCFHSVKWTNTQKNYSVGELEALAIVYAFDRWKGLLDRPTKKLMVYTDHLPLIGKLFKLDEVNSIRGKRIKTWFNMLNEFRYQLCHVPGASMGDAPQIVLIANPMPILRAHNPNLLMPLSLMCT